jgi:hypothetical protein
MTLAAYPSRICRQLELVNLRASRTVRQNILKILPRIRRVAGEIKRIHGIEMLAIGKESVAVRVAELTAVV